MLTAGIAVDKATLDFDRIFSYIVPDDLRDVTKKGSIVIVPFGRGNRPRLGVVLNVEEKDDVSGLKTVIDARDDSIVIDDYVFSLISYLKENTFCTWYDAVKTVVPYGAMYKISGNRLERTLTRHTKDLFTSERGADDSMLKTQKQKKVFEACRDRWLDLERIKDECRVGDSVIKGLADKGILRRKTVDRDTRAYAYIEKCREPVELTRHQQEVYEEISNARDKKTHLIFGVTSSGKSMIFIKLIQDALERGKSAMILVPEISLTPQMIRLMKEHFGNVVSVIHSMLSPTERLLQYNRALSGRSRVLVGTRSAVFTPLRDLELIIVDEEHEKTFKSESSPRYSAIRVAQQIVRMTDARLVLASATPSIESYYLAKNGYYHLHTLTQRYMDMPLPKVEIVDLARRTVSGSGGIVPDEMIERLKSNTELGKQSIVLINRRGYSTIGICKDCRKVLQCEDCSVNLVRHKSSNRLVCHVCGRVYPVIDTCPECGGVIAYRGFGTQRIEEYIQEKIPQARLLRLDADAASSMGSHEEILDAFGRKEYDILVGTQMVAKGLNFEDVNLVCILGMDGSLNHRSYNSNEGAFNLMTQVIGRAGRMHSGAKALIRTYDPLNPVIRLAALQDYPSFYENEIAYRKVNNYPPFCTMVNVVFSDEKENRPKEDADRFLRIMKEKTKSYDIPLRVLGPAPFDILMANRVYRWKLSVKCINNVTFRQYLNECLEDYLTDKDKRSAVYININPIAE
jgi:primosomal protein N' (replication factor Y)